MPIYNSFIIFLIGFLPLVGEIFPQTPEKSERKFKNLLFEQRHSGLKNFKKESFNGHKKYYYYIIVDKSR